MLKNIKIIYICLLITLTVLSNAAEQQFPWDHGDLVISKDGHTLQHRDGTAFFWLGDTAWSAFDKIYVFEYWQLFAGACGHTYGNNAIRQMFNPGYNAKNYSAPGAVVYDK